MRVEFDPGRRKFFKLAGVTTVGLLLRSCRLTSLTPEAFIPLECPYCEDLRAYLEIRKKTPEQELCLRLPLEGDISVTQGFWEGHRAIDIGSDEGTPVLAAADGMVSIVTNDPGREIEKISLKSMSAWIDKKGVERKRIEYVVKKEWVGGLGQYVVIDHGRGFETVYGHLKEFTVKEGERVLAGEEIGEVGMTGDTSGPHLHFEVKKDGEKLNPIPYLDISCEK